MIERSTEKAGPSLGCFVEMILVLSLIVSDGGKAYTKCTFTFADFNTAH